MRNDRQRGRLPVFGLARLAKGVSLRYPARAAL